ncbi:aspartate kinase [Vibrio mimicus]|nr:aspartate kinase [Vibrio mimicus]
MMSYTVEKIGGTSMTAFDAVLDNILLRPAQPYGRVFVVSAYSGITDALLECKRTGAAGIYQKIAKHDESWLDALYALEQRMLLINENLFADAMTRLRADKFIRARLAEAVACIQNILETCQYGQFSLRHSLPQIREFLASIGESHSAYNTALKLNTLGINARFVDLSGWSEPCQGNLDQVIENAFRNIDVDSELPIVTGYASCQEGLMRTYDRGYSEMTFSRIAVVMGAEQAIIHKEYHLSSADPRLVGADKVQPIGLSNFDVADQLANLGMEAIHPNAAAGLRQKNIELRIKNTFEPEHPGTLITAQYQPQQHRVEIIAGRDKVFALHLFDQSMVGMMDEVSHELIEWIRDAKVQLIGKEMNANSITYYLSGSSEHLNHIRYQAERRYPQAAVSVRMVALISAIGSHMETNKVLAQGLQALLEQQIEPMAAHSSMRNVNVQFVVDDADYSTGVSVLHQALMPFTQPSKTRKVA